MPWVLNSATAGDTRSYSAAVGETLYLIQCNADLTATHTLPDQASLVLGTLAIHSYGARLEAGTQDLQICPGSLDPVLESSSHPLRNGSDSPPIENFVLQSKSENRVETVILRHQDRIISQDCPSGLIFYWSSPQVQVHSSVAVEKEVRDFESSAPNGEGGRDEEEIEDDKRDLDNQNPSNADKSQMIPNLTPLNSLSGAEVVEETPTANRFDESIAKTTRIEPPALSEETSTTTGVIFSTAPQENNDDAELEEVGSQESDHDIDQPEVGFELPKRPSRHHKVKITYSAKRRSPGLEQPDVSPAARPAKRTKTEKEPDRSEHSDSEETPRRTPGRPRKRVGPPISKPSPTPSRSQRSTPRSTADNSFPDGTYDGSKPRVAFSNSSIQPTSQFTKYLKKNGGTIVESIDADCNILCIKPTALLKTTKLLHSIALGIPVVTDNWLIDSSKASRLLPLEPYKHPDLGQVWGKPQTELFSNYTFFFTPTLKAAYKDAWSGMEKLCKAVGARRVLSRKDVGGAAETAASADGETWVFLVAEEGDADVEVLAEKECACYSKDFLTSCVVRGEVDLDSEKFRVDIKIGTKGKGKAGRKGGRRNA